MKTITLLKNLEMAGVLYEEGQTIDVEDHVYDFLMSSYMEERRAMIEAMKKHEAEIAALEDKEQKKKTK